MPEILETFSTYLARIEKVQDQLNKPIVISTEVPMPTLRDGDIEKVPIGWPLYRHNIFYLVKVPPNKHVKRHSHDEDVFRFIVKGSLLLNGSIKIDAGMWFVIRANTPYEIDTETGYISFNGYVPRCPATGPEGKHFVDEEAVFSLQNLFQ